MDDQIVSFIGGLKSDKQVASLDEAAIKQTVVMRLLFLLGWDIFNIDEVNSNCKAKNQLIDYSLRSQSSDKIFISVQKTGKALTKNQQLLLEYASKEGVEFTVFTNGLVWWFYLTAGKKNPDQKRFCSLDFPNQNTADIADRLNDFLAKTSVTKGKALELAEGILEKRHQRLIEETIPEAWARVLSEPPNELVNLLIKETEKICGHAVEKSAVVKFLTEDSNRLQSSSSRAAQKPPAEEPPKASAPQKAPEPEKASPLPKKPEPPKAPEPEKVSEPPITPEPVYTEQSLLSFTFKKKVYPVKSGADMIMKLCGVLHSQYKKDIGRLLWHSVGNRYYFTKNMKDLNFPEEIGSTGIFFPTNMTPNEAVKVAYSIVSFFEFPEDDFSVPVENK